MRRRIDQSSFLIFLSRCPLYIAAVHIPKYRVMAENSNPWLLFITVFIVTVTLLDSRNEFFLITGNLIAFVQIVIYPNVKNLFYPYFANELELRNSGNIAKFAPVDIYSTTETPGW